MITFPLLYLNGCIHRTCIYVSLTASFNPALSNTESQNQSLSLFADLSSYSEKTSNLESLLTAGKSLVYRTVTSIFTSLTPNKV